MQLLYPLEVHSQQEAPIDTVSDEPENVEPETQPQEKSVCTETPQGPPAQEPRRGSQRSAAKQADNQRKAACLNLNDCTKITLWLTSSGQRGEDVVN